MARKNKKVTPTWKKKESLPVGAQIVPDTGSHDNDSAPSDNVASDLIIDQMSTYIPNRFRYVERAPLWMLHLTARSKFLGALAACVVLSVLTLVFLIAAYITLMTCASVFIPTIPNTIVATLGVPVSDIQAKQDTFIFMVVMPTLFIAVALALVCGLVLYRCIAWYVRYVVALLSCAVVSKEVVSRMAHVRRERRKDYGLVQKKRQRYHIVDLVDGPSPEESSSNDNKNSTKSDSDNK